MQKAAVFFETVAFGVVLSKIDPVFVYKFNMFKKKKKDQSFLHSFHSFVQIRASDFVEYYTMFHHE